MRGSRIRSTCPRRQDVRLEPLDRTSEWTHGKAPRTSPTMLRTGHEPMHERVERSAATRRERLREAEARRGDGRAAEDLRHLNFAQQASNAPARIQPENC